MIRAAVVLLAALLAGCATPATTPTEPTAPSASPPATTSPTIALDPSSDPVALSGQVAYVAGDDPQIWLLDLASGESRQLTELGPQDAEPEAAGPWRAMISCFFGPGGLAWSPDGRQLAFGYGGCEHVLHLVDPAGNRQRVADGGFPTWSPDGRMLAFTPPIPYAPCGRGCLTPPFPGAYDLHLVDVGGGGAPRPLSVDGATFAAGQARFSPDGTLIVHTGPLPEGVQDPSFFSATYVTAADGSASALVRAGAWPLGWLPDGRIVIVDEPTGDSVAVDVESGNATPILPGRMLASISPDGRLAVEWDSDPVSGATVSRIRTLDGNLVAELPGAFGAWSPDGGHVAFVDDRLTGIVVLAADGTVVAEWDVDGPIFPPFAWRPGS